MSVELRYFADSRTQKICLHLPFIGEENYVNDKHMERIKLSEKRKDPQFCCTIKDIHIVKAN